MKAIVDRLETYGEFEITYFGDDTILNKPIAEWPACDCLLSWHSDGFPLGKVATTSSLYTMSSPLLVVGCPCLTFRHLCHACCPGTRWPFYIHTSAACCRIHKDLCTVLCHRMDQRMLLVQSEHQPALR
jgi:hypothetical protein